MLDEAHFGFFFQPPGSRAGGRTGKVPGIEAAGGTFEVLRRNIAYHANIEAVRQPPAMPKERSPSTSSQPCTQNITRWSRASLKRRLAKASRPGSCGTGLSFDQLMEERNLYAHFIKIDVEGRSTGGSRAENWLNTPRPLALYGVPGGTAQ